MPVTVRFSNFTGLPQLPDNDPQSNPRGMAIRLYAPGGAATTDLVAHSYNGFPTSTVEELTAFLRALAVSGPGTPDPKPIAKFLPEPSGRGEVCPGAEARASQLRDRKFLRCERVSLYQSSRQTAVWPLTNPSRRTGASSQRRRSCLAIAQLPVRRTRRTIEKRKRPIPPGRPVGGQRDQITDATQTWPDTRPVVELGTIEVRRIVENSDALQRTMVFDPMRLIDGVEPSDDPILQARPAAYSVSYRRRTASS